MPVSPEHVQGCQFQKAKKQNKKQTIPQLKYLLKQLNCNFLLALRKGRYSTFCRILSNLLTDMIFSYECWT